MLNSKTGSLQVFLKSGRIIFLVKNFLGLRLAPPYRSCTLFTFRRRNVQSLAKAPGVRFLTCVATFLETPSDFPLNLWQWINYKYDKGFKYAL